MHKCGENKVAGIWREQAMNKNENALVILYRVFLQVIKISPIAGILSLTYNVIEGLFPAYLTYISAMLFETVEKYINSSGDISRVKWLGLQLLMGYGIKQIFQFISSITINAGVYEKVSSESNGILYKKCAELSLIEYEDADTMDSKRRASECVKNEIISQLYIMNGTIIINAIGVVSVIIILSVYSVMFIPICLLSVTPYFIVRIIRGKEFYQLKRQQTKKERRKSYLWSLFTNKQSIKEMRVMGFGDYISQKWIRVRNEVNEETWRLVVKDGLSLLLCDFIRIFGYALSILLAFILVVKGEISVGVFAACIGAFTSLQGQIKSFLIELGNIPEKINYAQDYFRFIDRKEDDLFCGTKSDDIKEVCFEDATFKYPNSNKNAIENLNISIKSGEKIALVGENGSGKTTFTKLLLGIYSPMTGKVLINNEALWEYNRKDYQRRLSIISQNFVQYHMTLRENVAISDIEGVSDDNAIRYALRHAGFDLDESIMNLDTMLGTRFGGVELSGGQWQKLAIARGIFRECEMIIMDEPTSAIDPISETEILKRFIKIAENKTAIIVSHRTGICTLVDKVAVMKDGQVVEFGTHKSLLKENGEYARLFNAQRRWYV